MKKSIVVFCSTLGRGTSKSKAFFQVSPLHYKGVVFLLLKDDDASSSSSDEGDDDDKEHEKN